MREVKTEKFQGPLGLLLSLIEKQKLDITEITLASIADQYLEYIKTDQSITSQELSNFLIVAAKLIYIKSKALLPFLEDEEEEEEVKDLQKQLKIYQKFAQASEKLEEMVKTDPYLYSKEFKTARDRRQFMNLDKFIAPKNLKSQDLYTSYHKLIDRLKQEKQPSLEEQKLETRISVEEKIESIRKKLQSKMKLSFNQLSRNAHNKTEIIVNFLAILELSKQNQLKLEQSESFSDISLSY